MSITAIASTVPAAHAQRIPEAMEGLGSDHDGDADDKGVSAPSVGNVSSAPPGMGAAVDTQA